MNRHRSVAVFASLLALPLTAFAQMVTPPFVQNGNVVTTPANGSFNNATFNDQTAAYSVTIAPSPASGTLSLTNSSEVVLVGPGSSITTSNNVSVTSTGSDALAIIGNAATTENQINNAATINASAIGLRLDGAAATTNAITNSGFVTSGGTAAVQLTGPSSTGSNTITNSGRILSTAGYGLYLFGDSTPTNTISNTGNINATSAGIYLSGNSSTLNTLTNSGTIMTSSGDGIELVGNSAGKNSFNNSGNVTSTGGEGIFFQGEGGNGSNQFVNSGTIVAGGGNGLDLQMEGVAGGNSVMNTGNVTGSTNGINVSESSSGPDSFTNTASVIGNGGDGIEIVNDGATSNTILNSGNVQGTTEGLVFSGDGLGPNTFTNTGVITAGTGYGLDYSGNGAASNAFYNTGSITSASGGGISFAGNGSSGVPTNTFTNTGAVHAGAIGIYFQSQGAGNNMFVNSAQVTSTTADGLDYLGDGATSNNVLNTGAITGGTSGAVFSVTGPDTFQFMNSGALTGNGDIGLSLTSDGNVTSFVTNTGAVTGDTDGIDYTTSSGQVSSFSNSGSVTGNGGNGITLTTPGETLRTSFVNSGAVTGSALGIDIDTTSSGNNSFINSGLVTGQGGDGADVSNQGTMNNVVTNTGTIHGSTNGLAVAGDGSLSEVITNTGLLQGDAGDALQVSGSTTGTTAIVLAGGMESGTTHSVEITAGAAPTVSVLGRSSLNHDILNSGTLGTFNLDIVGVTPQEAAAIRAMNGDTSGSISTTPGYTYTWENLTLNANAVSLESEVDPGLQSAARAIDRNGLAAPAYDPFYLSAVSNPEGALNLLVGREIDQAIDTNEVNQGTMLAYQVNNHLDGINGAVGGFDLSGLQVSSSSLLAFAGTDSQLDSLLSLDRFGGTEMSTDTKDEGRQMVTSEAPRWGAWAAGTVTLADSSTTSSTPGYQATTGSPMLGLDYRLCSDFVVGALINYSTTGANFGDGSRLGAETGIFGLYSAWHPGKWHLNTFIAGGYTSYDIDRTTFGSTANAHPSGAQAIGDATGGYDIDLGHHARFIPELGLTYTYVGVDGYTEGNAGAFDLSKNEQDIDSLRSHIGGRLTSAFSAFGGAVTFIPELRASYYHEFMDDSRGVTTSLPGGAALGAFPVGTNNPERNFALVGVGISTAFKGGGLPMAAFVNYDVQAGQSNYIANNINAGLRVSF